MTTHAIDAELPPQLKLAFLATIPMCVLLADFLLNKRLDPLSISSVQLISLGVMLGATGWRVYNWPRRHLGSHAFNMAYRGIQALWIGLLVVLPQINLLNTHNQLTAFAVVSLVILLSSNSAEQVEYQSVRLSASGAVTTLILVVFAWSATLGLLLFTQSIFLAAAVGTCIVFCIPSPTLPNTNKPKDYLCASVFLLGFVTFLSASLTPTAF